MRKFILTLLLFCPLLLLNGQNIAGYEYWFDYGYENRIKTSTGNGNIDLSLDVSQLSEGIHFYNFRAKDNNGNWSAPLTQYFFRVSTQQISNRIASYEYWIDKDYASRKKVTGDNSIVNLDVDVTALNIGMHYFNFRSRDTKGNWSAPFTQYFYKPEIVNADNKIVAYEYWCNDAHDSKKKVNLEQSVNPFELQNQLLAVNNLLTTGTPDSFEFEVDVYGNAKIYYSGSNRFNIRFLDANNNWSTTSVSLFADGKGVEVKADTLYSEVPVTKTKPVSDEIHFYKLDALKGDSLIWKTDQPCTIQVFDPFGVEVYKVSGEETLSFEGVRVKRDGIYHVLLHSVDSYDSQITLNCKHIHKYAVLGHDVKKVGNIGESMINFDGNGFESSTRITLTNKNNVEIIPDTVICRGLGKLSTIIDFTDRIKGIYDINVIFRDTTIVFENGIEIEDSKPIELDVSVIGPSDFRIGSPITYTITVKNNGNATAYQVPLNIKIISNAENAIQNLKLSDNIPHPQMPENLDLSTFSEDDRNAIIKYYNDFQDIYHFLYLFDEETGNYIYTNDFFLENIAPNSTATITMSFISSASIDIEAIVPKEWRIYGNHSEENVELKSNIVCCLYNTIDCVLSIAELYEGFPLSGCVYSGVRAGLGFAFSVGCDESETVGEKIASGTTSLYNSIISTMLGCLSDEAKKLNVFWMVMDKMKDVVNTGVTCGNAINSWVSGDCLGEPEKDKQHSEGVQSYDPNDKLGYRSPSGSTYFKEDITNMTYVINFENDPEKATAAAQDVYITDELDMTKFDINSFRAGHVMIGDKIAQAPYDAKNHTWEIDMRPEINLITRVNLSLDESTGIAKWHFASIDPATDEPTTDVYAGFLPPNDASGRGQGLVSFTIDLKKELPDDVEVSNTASIVFDYNEPILTPPWVNHKDIVAPVSRMLQPIEKDENTILVQWEGEDNASGIWHYNVYLRTGENGSWNALATNTEQTEIDFEYEVDTSYAFYVMATDAAGNKESKALLPEVIFFKQATDMKDISQNLPVVYPNPTTGIVYIENVVKTDIKVYNQLGELLLQSNDNKVDLSDYNSGIYFIYIENKVFKIIKL